MVGRPSLEPELTSVRGAAHRRRVAFAGAALVGWLASPSAWADAGSPATDQPSEPPAEQVETPEEPASEPPEPEALVPQPELPPPEEQLAPEEPAPPPGMVSPTPRYVPPIRFNGRPGVDEEGAPTRMETADGVTMLSNRPEPTEEMGAEQPTDPHEPTARQVDDEPAADTPTMAVLPNQTPMPRKGRKKAEDDSPGLGWIWLLVGAAGLLLVPIGVLLNRGARRQTSVPPSRSGV